MASLLADRKGYLFVDFYFQRHRCREYQTLRDTRDNRREKKTFVRDLQAALRQPNFDYRKWFPDSPRAAKFSPAKNLSTVSAYYASWLGTLEVSEATRYDYECLARAYLDRTPLGTIEVAQVTATDIREVVKSAAPRRGVMLLQRLRSMFDSAIDDGLMERNPARRVRNPRSRERKEPVEPFTLAEQTRIMDAAGEQDRNFVALLLGTGLRPGELVAIRRKDVDLDRCRLVVSGSIGRFGEGTTKTGSTRIVDLHDKVAPVLEALLSQTKILKTSEFLFTNQNGRPLNFVNWRSRNWKDILEAAKVAYRSPYACRHTFAIRMLEANRDVVYVARQLGHTNTDMIHRHYARWTVSRISEENLRV